MSLSDINDASTAIPGIKLSYLDFLLVESYALHDIKARHLVGFGVSQVGGL